MAFNPGSGGNSIAGAADVVFNKPSHLQVLTYNGPTSKWQNQPLPKLVFNVKDYGAKGDGLVDETVAIQTAVDALGVAGGGALFFPPGEYRVLGYVLLVSNMEIYGPGATIRKTGSTSTYCVFVGLAGNRLGYGGGIQNIHLHDLQFRGDLVNGKSLSAMSLHRAAHIRVRDCSFLETTQNGHVFDLQGCEDVVIESSVFRGTKPIAGREYVENIQLDASISVGVGFPTSLAAGETFDGTPTRQVTVRNCTFGGIQVGATYYPSACPLGSHTYTEGTYHENITFDNNTVENVTARGSSYYGMLHFLGVKDITITNNRFDAAGVFNTAIRCYRGANAIAQADVNNANATTITPQTMSVPIDVVITGNTFSNFTNPTSANIIEVYGSSVSNIASNITVSRNIFSNNFQAGAVVGDLGAGCIDISYVSAVNVSENQVSRARTVYYVRNAQGVVANGNTASDVAMTPLLLQDCTNTTQYGNTLMNQAQPCAINRGANHTVSGNTLSNFAATDSTNGKGWTFAATSACVIQGNILISASSAANGLEFKTGATKNSVAGNIIRGFSTAISALDTATLDSNVNNITS